MGKYFIRVLLVLLLINFIYKGVKYIASDKSEGLVVSYDFISSKYKNRGKTSFEEIKSPHITVKFDGLNYELNNKKWVFFNKLDLDSQVTVIANDERTDFNINSFFHYWVTFYDIILAFCICFGGSIFLGIVLPERKPTEWK